MTPRALIFDVDGTLADTEEAHRLAFNAAFAAHSLAWQWRRDTYRRLLRITGGKERIAAFIDEQDLPPAERQRLHALIPALHAQKTRHYSASVQSGKVPLRPGVRRLLHEARARQCRLAIASTTTQENVDALLAHNLGAASSALFSVIACGDIVAAKKPAPDIYLLALQRLQLRAAQAVAFEDSAAGLRSARDAGLLTVVTPTFWTEGQDFTDAALLLPSLGEPDAPLAGEPGGQLRHNAWLDFNELIDAAASAPAASALQ